MIILDTNVISAMMRQPDTQLIHWLDQQPLESLWTTSICVYEIEYGLRSLPAGKRRKGLEKAFQEALDEDLQGRVLDFDRAAAVAAAKISTLLRKVGRTIEVYDTMIAGIVASRRGTIATRNVKHFELAEILVVNPWE